MTGDTKNLLKLIHCLDEQCDGVQMRLLAKRLLAERDDAQEAAEEYHAVWQEQYERCREILAEGLARELALEAQITQQKEWRREEREELQRVMAQRDEAWRALEPVTEERNDLAEIVASGIPLLKAQPLTDGLLIWRTRLEKWLDHHRPGAQQ